MRRYFNLFVVLILATLSRAQVRVWEGTPSCPITKRGWLIRILRSTTRMARGEAVPLVQ